MIRYPTRNVLKHYYFYMVQRNLLLLKLYFALQGINMICEKWEKSEFK